MKAKLKGHLISGEMKSSLLISSPATQARVPEVGTKPKLIAKVLNKKALLKADQIHLGGGPPKFQNQTIKASPPASHVASTRNQERKVPIIPKYGEKIV
jgi:hypothetical protein